MKRPAFQFYPGDWRTNAKLRRCSPAARGAWMDVMCVLHASDEYGIVRWPLAELAMAAAVPLKLLKELADKSVLKGADRGCPAYEYRPNHAGKQGEPVVLVAAADGPCWYCSRFVRDEWIRQRRGAQTQFTSENQPPPKAEPKQSPTEQPKAAPMPPIGGLFGDGPSSSSSASSSEQEQTEASASVVASKRATHCPHAEIIALYHEVLPSLCRVREWTEDRQALLRKRWTEKAERRSIDWWRRFFEYVSQSDWLMGRKEGRDGPFECDLEWLIRPKNFVKVIEGRYENKGAAA